MDKHKNTMIGKTSKEVLSNFKTNLEVLISAFKNEEKIIKMFDDGAYDDIIFANRGEAETVLEHMDDIIAKHGHCSISDLYDLIGYTSNYADTKVGWTDLRGGSSITRGRYGYTLNLSKPVTLK